MKSLTSFLRFSLRVPTINSTSRTNATTRVSNVRRATNVMSSGAVDCYDFCSRRRWFSSVVPEEVSTENSLTLSVPSNLQLVDENILQKDLEEIEEELVPIERYLFPKLHKDTKAELPIHRFREPGTVHSEFTAKLDPNIFSVALRKDIVLEMVRYQRNKIRQPQSAKRRKDIAGSNKKPWNQKGLGRAQFGNKRNSIWKGGQKAHGPVLRNFNIYTNRKQRAMALMITLAAKLEEDNIMVVDELSADRVKTKDISTLLKQHNLSRYRCLLVDERVSPEFEKSTDNLPLHTTMEQRKTNVYDLMKRDKLVITAPALESLQKRVMEQYLHKGKMKSYLRNMQEYLAATRTTSVG